MFPVQWKYLSVFICISGMFYFYFFNLFMLAFVIDDSISLFDHETIVISHVGIVTVTLLNIYHPAALTIGPIFRTFKGGLYIFLLQ